MIDAVRYHHTPSQTDSVLAALLYCCESWTDDHEDIYDLSDHRHACDLLGLASSELRIRTTNRPDLRLLRFAA